MNTSDTRVQAAGFALLALVLLWQYVYVLIAFRRVYADGWASGAAKAALMLVVKLLASNRDTRLRPTLTVEPSSTASASGPGS